MTHEHLNPGLPREWTERLLQDRTNALREILRCPVCREVLLSWLWNDSDEPPTGGGELEYGGFFRRAVERVRREMPRPAPAGGQRDPLARLEGVHPPQAWLWLKNTPAAWSLDTAKALVKVTADGLVHDARWVESAGLFTVFIAEQLAEEGGTPASLLTSLRLRGWCGVGRARKLEVDFEGASNGFARAEQHLEESADPLDHAFFHQQLASLWVYRRRLREAERSNARAIGILQSIGELESEARSWMGLAYIEEIAGQPRSALWYLRRAARLLEDRMEPQQEIYLRHNEAMTLCVAGEFALAEKRYEQHRALYDSFPQPVVQLRRFWLRGRIDAGLGRFREAEAAFRAAGEWLEDRRNRQDRALLSLELAELYRDRGDSRQAQATAAEILPVFRRLGMPLEAAKAERLLQRPAGSPPQRK